MIINVCGWGQEPGRKGGDRKWDSQGDGKREKQEKTRQQHAIFCNRKSANRQEPAKTGLKAGGLSPLHPPPPHVCCYAEMFPNFEMQGSILNFKI